VEPDVDHGIACTCHWTSVGYLNLLADVLDPLNELGGFVSLSWSRRGVSRGDRKGKCNIYGTQWLESQPHLKGAVAG
jgi:hypothetical protein